MEKGSSSSSLSEGPLRGNAGTEERNLSCRWPPSPMKSLVQGRNRILTLCVNTPPPPYKFPPHNFSLFLFVTELCECRQCARARSDHSEIDQSVCLGSRVERARRRDRQQAINRRWRRALSHLPTDGGLIKQPPNITRTYTNVLLY